MNELGRGRFKAYSAGSHPKGVVHPQAIRTLANWRIPTDALRSKSWDELAQPGAPQMDFVFTVCDNAAGEVCPFWPGRPLTAHWGVPDPAACAGTPEAQAQAFLAAALTLKRRIELMLALPLPALAAPQIEREIKAIGSR